MDWWHDVDIGNFTVGSAENPDLFCYISARFLYNEDVRLKERYVEFNVDALRQGAAKHLGSSHGKVACLTKFAEGGFNRVLLLTMEDGFQAVAKIPYRTTYLRSKGIPVPRVYGYSSTTDDPVGVEYITMERAPGEASNFKRDVPVDLQAALYADSHEGNEDSEKFCIGPIADYMFWYGKRAGLDIDRGPYLNANNIFVSPESGAISCIIDWQHTTTAKNPPDLREPSLPSDYESLTPEEKAQAEELYRRRLLFYYYRIFNGHLNKAHLQTLRDPLLLPRQHLVDRAGRQWSGNLMTLKGALVRMVEYWPHLPDTKGIECPVQFTEAELNDFSNQEQVWFRLNTLVNHWREELGAVRKVKELKQSLVDTAEGDEEDSELLERGWPFRDHEENY
ncbi:phosphotransferase enzyme family protein [Thermoascus aurantiacus ATCC 26904]